MIILKNDKEIEIMRTGGKRLAKILKRLMRQIRPGVTTRDLERLACELIAKTGGQPSFKGYQSEHDKKPYPTALCLSVNNEVVHAPALPSRVLKAGDIIGVDVGMKYNGYYIDVAATVGVGEISKEAKRLIDTAKKSLKLGIKMVKPENTINDIGSAIEEFVLASGFSVVRDLVGHGVGHGVHEEPQIPNFASEGGKNIILKPGIVLAIEPMINAGSYQVFTAADGLTIKTADGSLSAHFEHTVAVTKRGHVILTN